MSVSAVALVLGVGLGAATLLLVRSRRRLRAAEPDLRRARDDLDERSRHPAEQLETPGGRLRATLDSLLEGCQVVGFDWRYRYLNPAAAAHGRRTVDELLGRTMMEAYPGIETTPLWQVIDRCLRDRVPHRMENEFEYPDGSRGWFALSIEPVPEGVFILSVDITDQKRSEAALRRSEARHRALLSGLPDLVFVLDRSGVFVDYHAPDSARLLVPPEDFLGRRLQEVLPAEVTRSIEDGIARAVAQGAPTTVEYQLALGPEMRRFEAKVVPTDGDRVTVVARDATERQRLELQLRQAQKMEAIGQLTGGIAHDFNNILTVIGSNAELIAREIGEDTPARADLSDLEAAVRRGAEMVGQLLRFSRSGMLERRPANPAAAIRSFASTLQRLLPASVRVEVAGDEQPGAVLLDTGVLQQMLMNLCTNARDAMPDGGTIRIECFAASLDEAYQATHPWVRPGRYVCVAVSDTGIGMDEPTRQRIFEPFFTTKPAGVGTGLGLSMVYGQMKDHEGMVHVYSELGQGTVVRLYFPTVEGATPEVPRSRPSDDGASQGGTETVLLVEDDAAIRRASRRALEGRGYTVLEAADGREALDTYGRHREAIALVISDLVMPRLGGRQMAEALRTMGSTVPILFTSGYAPSAAYRTADLPPGVAFLHKPWTLRDLFTRVRELLDRPDRERRE